MRHVVATVMLGILCGCMSSSSGTFSYRQVTGIFSQGWSDAELQFQLMSDQKYYEYVIHRKEIVYGVAGGFPREERRSSGRWTLQEDQIVFTASTGREWVVTVVRDQGDLFLIDGERRFRKVDPRRPNKAPEPTPGSVTPRAFSGEVKLKQRSADRNPARGAPVPVVAHL
jgi:hypothetical protein